MLFGHQDDTTDQATVADSDTKTTAADANPLAADPATGASLPAVPTEEQVVEPTPAVVGSVLDQPTSATDTTATAPSLDSSDQPAASTGPVVSPVADRPSLANTEGDDLLQLKTQALNQLSPLINHLDQTPEEKFRTTMMLIQSTDNQALLKDAYSAANAITDDKVRAQALLDVVNEINYFTQPKAS